MKIINLFWTLLSFSKAMSNTHTPSERPNIILFLVDDLGWQDCSLPFWTQKTPLNEKYHTPHMNQLAREGMKFTNAYATPVCTPTRVSLLTGMNTGHHKVTNWTSVQANTTTDYSDNQFDVSEWNYNGLSNISGIPRTIYATPFPQILQDNGYFTILVGKAHWGPKGMPGSNPKNLGFMVNIAGNEIGGTSSYHGENDYGNSPALCCKHAVPDLEQYHGTHTFLTEALTREAIKGISVPLQSGKPFFLMLSHYAVHEPYDKDDRFYKKYLQKGLPDKEARYAALIEGMDKSLGDIMAFLKEKNSDKNTIILFISDNGGLSLAYARAGQPFTHNAPLRSGKGSVYEGGIREPMIVKWYNVVAPNTTSEAPVIIEDFFPTILEMAGVKNYKTVQETDGVSFIPQLKNPNPNTNDNVLIWHYPNKWWPEDGPGINYKSAIRKGVWKLIYNYRDSSQELYNLKNDIGEQHNLVSQNKEKAEELHTLLFQKLTLWNAPFPILKKQ